MLAYHRAVRIVFLLTNHRIQAELLHTLRELLGEGQGLGLRMRVGGRYDHHYRRAFNDTVVAAPPSQRPSVPFCSVHESVVPYARLRAVHALLIRTILAYPTRYHNR